MLVVIALVLVGGGVALVLWWVDSNESPSSAERLQECEAEHLVGEDPLRRPGDQVLGRCSWPAPGPDPDGYHEIAVTLREHHDVDKRLVAYTFVGPCQRLGYRLGDGPRQDVTAGQVIDGRSGGPVTLTPELLALVPELSPGTLAVLTTPDEPVTDVHCLA